MTGTSETDKDTPEGCMVCNKEQISKFFSDNGIFGLHIVQIHGSDPVELEEGEELTPPCGVCGAVFLINWAKCDIDN